METRKASSQNTGEASESTEYSSFEKFSSEEAASERRRAGSYSIRPILAEVFGRIEAYSKEEGVAILTGYKDLDSITSGLRSGEVVVLGGIPGIGKTSFAISIMGNASIDKKWRTVYASTKDSKQTLTERLLCGRAMVNGHLLRSGRLPQRDYPKLSIAVSAISAAPMSFFCEPRMTIKSIVDVAKAHRDETGIDLLIVDHLQMVLVDPARQNKYEDVTIAINELKRLARELDIAVLVVSAMNRGARDRNSPEPRLSDLGDSGAIETTSDTVMLLHRPEVFDMDEEKGKAVLDVAKQNSGPTGRIPLTFIADYASFVGYSGRSMSE
jgi:replicative DNA helicase